MRWQILPLASLPVLLACGEHRTAEAGDAVTRRDSAGVEIVESSASLWADGEGWRLASSPRLDIGAVDGRPEEQLFNVRGATVLGDGRIVVANSGTSEVRFFTPEGSYIDATGRNGEGPGEFSLLFGMSRLAGDTLVASDFRTRRLSRLSPDGVFLGAVTLGQPGDAKLPPRYAGSFPDGWHVVIASDMPPLEDLRDGMLIAMEDDYWLTDPSGVPVRQLGSFSRGEQLIRITHTVRPIGRVRDTGILTRPFAVGDPVVVADPGLRVAASDRHSIRFFDRDGDLLRIARFERALHPVTPQHIAAFMERGDPSPSVRRIREGDLEKAPPPETLPTATVLHVDPVGRLWIGPYGAGEEALMWDVIDETGAWLGPVSFPAGLRVLEIGDDYVLGVSRDEFDVEHLQLFELVKEAG